MTENGCDEESLFHLIAPRSAASLGWLDEIQSAAGQAPPTLRIRAQGEAREGALCVTSVGAEFAPDSAS